MHAERLDDDRVWALVQAALARRPWRWTIFVESLHARISGVELAARLDWLADQGHEIAQHTHHYVLEGEPGHPTGFSKGAEPTEAVIRACMEGGLTYLQDRGHRPIGFVSGAWRARDSVFAWLAANGFVYDSTLRTYRDLQDPSSLLAGAVSPVRSFGGVVEIPTTASLRDELRARTFGAGHPARAEDMTYELFYLHDYDLLRGRIRLGLRALEHRIGDNFEMLRVDELVRRVPSATG